MTDNGFVCNRVGSGHQFGSSVCPMCAMPPSYNAQPDPVSEPPLPPTITVPWEGAHGYPIDADEENHVCSRPGCGNKAWDDGVPLTYVTVTVLPGEEGYGEITQALCNQHLIAMTSALIMLGFVSHNHHGTQMFGDELVCGRDCPTPTEYGPEFVQPGGSL